MEGIVVLGIGFLLVSVVLPIVLLVAVGSLKKRVAKLEASAQVPRPTVQEKPIASPPEQPREPSFQQPEVATGPPKKSPPKAAAATAWDPAPKVKREKKPSNFVFSGEKIAELIKWSQDNWVFILAGVSLALAGVFLVQYGVEHGLLSPSMRVLAAIGFGGALIGVGEYIRRKTRGDEDGSFALLPSVFAGAGLVAVFAGVLSARMLYGLIGPEMAFAGLALTGALAVLLGWVYGPFLATLGVFGALAAPFLVGGDSDNAGPLHLYFALIAGVALAIDAYKRWAWLSALALVGAYGASFVLLGGSNTEFYAIMFAFITAMLAVAVPVLSLTPRHSGAPLLALISRRLNTGAIEFPTRVASGAFIAATVYICFIYINTGYYGPSLFWLVLMVLGLLLLAAVFWMKDAPALADLAFLPAFAGLYILATEAFEGRPVLKAWLADAERPQLDFADPTVGYLLVGALLASLAFAWRSYRLKPMPVANAVMAAGLAPWAAILIDVFWAPTYVLGAGNWALYLAVIAIVMVGLTERFSRIDTDDRTRTALFALSSMSMISFMLVVVLGDVALTMSIAVMVLASAWLGERFKLSLLNWYIQAGVVAVSYRLVIDPGLVWGFDAPIWEVVLAFAGVIFMLVAALRVKRAGPAGVVVVLESAIWTLSGILASLMLARWFEAQDADGQIYVMSAFSGLVWLMLSANQLYRLKADSRLRVLRIILASLYGVAALLFLAAAAIFNPAVDSYFEVVGWPVFGSLGLAYLLPALMLGGIAWRFTHLPRWLRVGFAVLAAGFATLWVGLEIRHFWQGDNMAGYGVLKPELYSYTVAMIATALGLLAIAFVRQSSGLRKLALVMVVLVVAKVYFVDVSELDGLLRVVSFLVLGLVAALMAWVNRMLKANEQASISE